jgi:hypothetical protein
LLAAETLPEEPDPRVGSLPLVPGGQGQGQVKGNPFPLVDLAELLLLPGNGPVGAQAQKLFMPALPFVLHAGGVAELMAEPTHLGDRFIAVSHI